MPSHFADLVQFGPFSPCRSKIGYGGCGVEIGHHESKGETSKFEMTKGDAKPPEKAEQRQRHVATPEVIKNKKVAQVAGKMRSTSLGP